MLMSTLLLQVTVSSAVLTQLLWGHELARCSDLDSEIPAPLGVAVSQCVRQCLEQWCLHRMSPAEVHPEGWEGQELAFLVFLESKRKGAL